MNSETIVHIKVTSRSGEAKPAILTMYTYSSKVRTKRALKTGAIGFGLAIAFVFLPIAHFVLVPLALILTPILISHVYRQAHFIPKQFFSCPKCSKDVEWPASSKIENTELLCESCRTVVGVSIEESR